MYDNSSFYRCNFQQSGCIKSRWTYKIKRTAILIAVSFSVILHADAQLTESEQAVQQTVIRIFDALSNRDSVSLKKYCTADISLYEYGQVWTIDTLISKAITLNTATDFKRTNTFNFISTITDKNSACVTYRLNSAINMNGKKATVQWLETVVLAKEKNRWKAKHLHSTLIKRD